MDEVISTFEGMTVEDYSATEEVMNKIKMVVFIDGGLVEQVISNWPVEMVVVDYDIECLDEDEIIKVMGEEMYVYRSIEGAEVNTDMVRQVFKDIGR
jgi:hypothetical protein